MISMKKQIFGLMLFVGGFIIMFTGLFINITVKNKVSDYIESNLKDITNSVEEIYSDIYQDGDWKEEIEEQLASQPYIDKSSITLLDNDKKVLWQHVSAELKTYDHQTQLKYMSQERPLHSKENKLIGYLRIDYVPSMFISKTDLKFQEDLNNSILWNSLIFVGWFIFAGIYITKLFTEPIYSIARTSMDLAQGKLSSRYTKKSRIREIEELRRSMNYLAERLEQQDMIRKRLISDISHEIRTPLHILQNNLEAMIDGIYPIDEEQMEILYEEVVRFGKLLNNLNMLRNTEENSNTINLKEIHLNSSIEDVFNTFKIAAQEKNIAYTMDLSQTEEITIYADINSIKQIWMNILSNAFKFTPENGEIHIYTLTKNRRATIVFKDSGIGISEQDLPYIFDRMYRGDKSREKYEGSGLGLTIVQKLVRTYEGKVSVESKEGEGTVVRITLPVYNTRLSPNIGERVKSYMKNIK